MIRSCGRITPGRDVYQGSLTYRNSRPNEGTKDDNNNGPPQIQFQFPAKEPRGEARQVRCRAHPHEEHDGLVRKAGISGITVLGAATLDTMSLDTDLAVQRVLPPTELGEDTSPWGIIVAGPGGRVGGPDLRLDGVFLFVLHCCSSFFFFLFFVLWEGPRVTHH